MANTARLQLIAGQFCTPHKAGTLSLCQEQMDTHIPLINSPLTDVPPNTWATTYRQMKAAAENTLLHASSSSIKWILKALFVGKERAHNHLQWLSFAKSSHSALTKLLFYLSAGTETSQGSTQNCAGSVQSAGLVRIQPCRKQLQPSVQIFCPQISGSLM